METIFVRYTFISLFIHRHNHLLQNEHINPIQPVALLISLIIIYNDPNLFNPIFCLFSKATININCPLIALHNCAISQLIV